MLLHTKYGVLRDRYVCRTSVNCCWRGGSPLPFSWAPPPCPLLVCLPSNRKHQAADNSSLAAQSLCWFRMYV